MEIFSKLFGDARASNIGDILHGSFEVIYAVRRKAQHNNEQKQYGRKKNESP